MDFFIRTVLLCVRVPRSCRCPSNSFLHAVKKWNLRPLPLEITEVSCDVIEDKTLQHSRWDQETELTSHRPARTAVLFLPMWSCVWNDTGYHKGLCQNDWRAFYTAGILCGFVKRGLLLGLIWANSYPVLQHCRLDVWQTFATKHVHMLWPFMSVIILH